MIPARALQVFQDQAVVLSPDDALGDEGRQQICFNIPQFQRGLRWSEKRRNEFLQSTSEGLPIGTLVLGRQPGGGTDRDIRTWTVLDGQQLLAEFL